MKKKAVSGIVLTLLLISMSTLAFNIQPVKADWTWTETIYIRADGSVYPDTAPISSVDNVTYTLTDNIVGDVPQYSRAIVVERDNIVVDGAGYTLQGTGAEYSIGIFLRGRSNVTIKNMEIKAFGIGIDFYGEFFVGGSYGGPPFACSITGNNITANNFGIYHCGSNHRITGNKITANNYWGVYLYLGSNNTVSGNNITNNSYGVYFWYSFYNNRFYHNNFIDNTVQVRSYHSTKKTWDNGYPSGGNYWSDYTGVDEFSGPNQDMPGADGIMDTPYIIDDYNLDNYPLVEPWSPRPPPPQEDLEELIETVKSWNLPAGTENSLTSKLEETILLLNKGNENGAVHKLMDFINQVEALRDKGKLENWQADYLISEAQIIIDLING